MSTRSFGPAVGTAGTTINVLVCSGNMGNAQPDLDSLNAWIPNNGYCRNVVSKTPKYPLANTMLDNIGSTSAHSNNNMTEPADQQTRRSTNDQKNSRLSISNTDQFDLIVIGMQEATFSVEDDENSGGEEQKKDITAATRKTIQAVSSLAIDKDHNDTTVTPAQKMRKSAIAIKSSINSLSFHSQRSSARSSANKGHKKKKMSRWFGSSVFSENPESVDMSNKSFPISTFTDIDGTNRSFTADADFELQKTDSHILHKMLQTRLPGYERIVSYQRGEMRLMVFSLIPMASDEFGDGDPTTNKLTDVRVISVKAQNTGKHGLANKGGIVAELLLNGTTRLALLTAHLEAHEGSSKYGLRCSSLHDILRGTASSVPAFRGIDSTLACHHTFVMGDLNFRTKLPYLTPGSEEHIKMTHTLANAKDWEELNCHDELRHALTVKDCLVGFKTPICNFPPTFKVLREDGYVYKDNRSPSYTDRILYHASNALENTIRPLVYEPIDSFTSSDHKPIRGAFSVELNPHMKKKPACTKRHRFGSLLIRKRTRMSAVSESKSPESLHLFMSDMRCSIKNNDGKSDMPPDPIICFVTTPSSALTIDLTVWESLLQRAGLKHLKTSMKKKDGSVIRTMQGWPRTKIKYTTYEPDWDEDEVHFKVSTHSACGTPIDLSGAMLHIAVFDARGNTQPRLIGSFTLNLAKFILASRQSPDEQSELISEMGGSSGQWTSGPSTSFRGVLDKKGSMTNIFASSARKATLASLPEPKTYQSSPTSRMGKQLDPVTKSSVQTSNHPEEASVSAVQEQYRSSLVSRKPSLPPLNEQTMSDPPPPPPLDALDIDETSDTEQQQRSEKAPISPETSVPDRRQSNSSATRPQLQDYKQSSILQSVQSIFGRRSCGDESRWDDAGIYSMKLDEPLMRYGKEVGRIHCTIDSWWLSDETAKAVSDSAEAVTRLSTSRKGKKRSFRTSGPSSPDFASPAMFSSRKHSALPSTLYD